MVFLRTAFFFIIFQLSGIALFSQEQSALQNAFSESFKLESLFKYSESAEILAKSYSADSYELNLRLGWLYYNAENYNKSDKYYSIAVGLMPYAIEAKLGATLPKSALDLWDDVLQLYTEVLEIDTKNNVALYNAGLIYYNRESYGDAYKCFSELNNLYPTDYSALLMHAWSAYRLGKVRDAKVLFNKLLLLYPNDESAKEGLLLLK